MCTQNPNPPFYFSSKRFYKRSSSQLQEVARGSAGGGECGALPGGPLNLAGRAATARTSNANSTVPANADQATSADQATTDGPVATAGHAPLGAEEKVR